MSTFDYSLEKFEKIISQFFISQKIDSPKIAVAISGGPDSLALCLIMHAWAVENQKEIIALTVDHNLRDESKEEAQKVSEWLLSYNIKHEILVWDHDTVKSGLQEKARIARYDLMTEFCKKHDIDMLCTAHHLNDQLETFMMRLSKGSGPEGLSGIKEKTIWNDVAILRPFLHVKSADLMHYLENKKQDYIKDPSNDDVKFERVRWRKTIKTMIENGFSIDHFSKSLERLNDLNDWANECVEDNFFEVVSYQKDFAELEISNLIQLHFSLSTRILRNVLQNISGQKYSTAYESVKDIIKSLIDNSFKTISSGGCVLTKKKNKIIITRDPRVK